MPDLFECILGVIGKSVNSAAFDQLCIATKEAPKISHCDTDVDYYFRKSGFSIMTVRGFVYSIFLHGDTVSTRFKRCNIFTGSLPNGIKFGEERADVHVKIGAPTKTEQPPKYDESTPDYWDDYSNADITTRYVFDGNSHKFVALSIRSNDESPK